MTATKGQTPDPDERAKAFIDSIIAINQKYGMGGSPSDETYEMAVRGSASVARATSREAHSGSA